MLDCHLPIHSSSYKLSREWHSHSPKMLYFSEKHQVYIKYVVRQWKLASIEKFRQNKIFYRFVPTKSLTSFKAG